MLDASTFRAQRGGNTFRLWVDHGVNYILIRDTIDEGQAIVIEIGDLDEFIAWLIDVQKELST